MLSRRQMLGTTLGGFFAFANRNYGQQLFAQRPSGLAKRCVVLWMDGGPSQLDTFDPKPGTANGGLFQAIPTSADDLFISETLPRIAGKMHQLSVIRNLSGTEGDHARAKYALRTGHELIPSFPRPALGSIISHETPPQEFPKYVTIGAAEFGPAFLGPDHAPFSIDDPRNALSLLRQMQSKNKQLELLKQLDQPFVESHGDSRMMRRQGMMNKIETMIGTRFLEALDVDRNSKQDRERYGNSRFGQGCLTARKLLEVGVSFVELQHGGWDTHQNNFDSVRRLCGEIDGPWATLMEDLEASGMLADTLVVWMGEFGRTPTINATNGRDHFPQVTPVVLGGGPIQGGIAVGSTGRSGNNIEGPSHRVADLFATMLSAFGIAPDHEYTTSFDSPTKVTDDGTVIAKLINS